MNNIAPDAFLSFLLDVSMRVCFIGLIAWAAIRIVQSIGLRNRVAVAAMLCMLLMPMLMSFGPEIPVSVFPATNSNSVASLEPAELVEGKFIDKERVNSERQAVQKPPPNVAEKTIEESNVVSAASIAKAVGQENKSTSTSQSYSWAFIGLAIYVAVATVFLARLIIACILSNSLVWNSQPISVDTTISPNRSTLRESPAIRAPMMLGVFRPVILLPASWREWSDEKLQSVITHESAHVARGDWIVTVVFELNRAIFWFHPMAWILKRYFAVTAEQCCDDAVIMSQGGRTSYARLLLEFAREVAKTKSRFRDGILFPVVNSMAREPVMETRITSILDTDRPLAGQLGRWHRGLLTSAACLMVFIFSSLALVRSTANDSELHVSNKPETNNGFDVEPSAVISDTPDVAIDGAPALRIRVLDAADDKPVKEFQVIAGVDVRDSIVSKEFIARHGKDMIVNWQSHMIRQGTKGEYLWPMKRIYSKLALRVQAEGYVPHRFKWIDKSRGSQTLVFRLKKDPRIAGRVVLPNGEGAAGAEVAIVITSRSVPFKGTSFGVGDPKPKDIRGRWRKGVVVKADAKGNFLLPTETDPSAFVLAISEYGTRQITFDKFNAEPQIELEQWGRLEGTVLIGKKPTANEKVTVYHLRRRGGVYPSSFTYHYKAVSNMAGQFVIPHFPPGVGEVALPDYIPRHDPKLGFSYIPPIPKNSMGRFHVKSGKTTKVKIGGEGLGEKQVNKSGEKPK